jgi:hypothetical protein
VLFTEIGYCSSSKCAHDGSGGAAMPAWLADQARRYDAAMRAMAPLSEPTAALTLADGSAMFLGIYW